MLFIGGMLIGVIGYLVNSQDAGIYLVGWFDTEKWEPEDSRRGRVPKIPIEGLSCCRSGA